MRDVEASVCSVLCVVCLFIGGFLIGVGITLSHVRQDAVDAGVAEWRCDAKTGDTEFKWKEPKP